MMKCSLIPRKILFEDPNAFGARLSPDGSLLSWIAPFEGILNIWIAPSGDVTSGEPLTRIKDRPINWQTWSAHGRYILFLNDKNGDEKHHLYIADPQTKEVRDLTPYDGVSAEPQMKSRDRPGAITVALNDRDERWHDLYEIDLASGERSLIWENKQEFSSVRTDWNFIPRFALSNADDGGSKLWRLEGTELEEWLHIPFEDRLTATYGPFDAAGEHVLKLSSVNRNTAALSWIDWNSGAELIVAEHSRYDISDTLHDPMTLEVEAASVDGVKKDWIYRSTQIEEDFVFLERNFPDFDIEIASQSFDNRQWIVVVQGAELPPVAHLYDRDRGGVEVLFHSRPSLRTHKLAPMHSVVERARDGLELQSYLTLPADIENDRPGKPLPMVLVVHGGPWARDKYGYRSEHQWLADRGYAVLSVNYRGSAGFGKDFIAASEKQHAAKMHDDLIDMVNWAIREGIADKDKIAILGGSYGGYASFVGVTFTPDIFCCAISIVGISNLQTLLESVPPYWASYREFLYRSFGDPRTEEGRALLADRSPIHKVDNIARPLLIFHGVNDVRCKVSESEQIVAAMQKKGLPVTYVVYSDEGHEFQSPYNRLSFFAMTEAFLARHLGGELEPLADELEQSTYEVRADDGVVLELQQWHP